MKKLTAAFFALALSSVASGGDLQKQNESINQKEKMNALLKPYGKDGEAVYKGITMLSERCDQQGSELAVLFYLATTTGFDLTKEAFINAKSDQEIKKIADNLDCPQ